MRIRIFPYKAGSRGARALAEALDCKVLKRVGSKFRFREGDLVINWGGVDCPFNGRGVANQNDAVAVARNKLTCFQAMKEHGVSVPSFWMKREDIPDEAFPVFCRTTLTGHSGQGIVVANNRDELVPAPLYTQYVKKKHEFRVHVLRDRQGQTSIITVQRKAKRNGADDANFMVRNLDNGFVYVDNQGDGLTPNDVLLNAFKAVEACGLAFGAVDVIWNEFQKKAYVLEINTAPGLEERTANAYAKALRVLV